jgi:hypothetical protein
MSTPQPSFLAMEIDDVCNFCGKARLPADHQLLRGRPPEKCGPAPKMAQQMERIQHLPRAPQRFVMPVIDTVLAQQDR